MPEIIPTSDKAQLSEASALGGRIAMLESQNSTLLVISALNMFANLITIVIAVLAASP